MSILFFGYGIKERLINICLILILPVLIFNQISQIAKNYFFNKYLDDSKIVIDKNADIDDIKNSIIERLKINEGDELKAFKKLDQATEKTLDSNRFLKKGVSTSGRYDIWKYSLSQYDKKKSLVMVFKLIDIY